MHIYVCSFAFICVLHVVRVEFGLLSNQHKLFLHYAGYILSLCWAEMCICLSVLLLSILNINVGLIFSYIPPA